MASKRKGASRGSQAWLQEAVRTRHAPLEAALVAALDRSGATVNWRSPLPPAYTEARDGRVFELLECQPRKRPLADFWPRRGPVWDALATVGDRCALFEAKAHIQELISGPTRATGSSLELIHRSLTRTRRSLAPRATVDWAASPFFQYANRLAFLHFLREDNAIDAHLICVYFLYDQEMRGPTTESEWRGALRLMYASMGLGEHKLSPFVHNIFVDVRELNRAVI